MVKNICNQDMKIILCRRYSICEPGIIKSLKRLGHEVVELHTEKDLQDYDKNYMFRLAAFIHSLLQYFLVDFCASNSFPHTVQITFIS